ncbi:unnamed protein product [Psylliodes chrysocephalus]|uniref:DUF4371 domain-containing protein n=1 Tax=Psylliodes chrysocephalus TaxID=3402493 RepID=A0A9P0D128_9CUCU|nr:unnamed protein product [Psylliodes chrysocephala]
MEELCTVPVNNNNVPRGFGAYGSKLVAQSYDGAAVIAGHLEGLQAKVKKKLKHAIFVQCIAHRLNLVLSRSMDNNVWDNKETWDAEIGTAAKGYLHWLKQNFDFNFLLNIFAEIFPFTDILFDILQTKSNDIGFCIKQIDDFKNKMNKKRDQFEHFWNKTQNIGLELERKRIRIDNVGDRETSYRRLYAENFDNILQQMNSRFQNFNELKFVELCNFNIRLETNKSLTDLGLANTEDSLPVQSLADEF